MTTNIEVSVPESADWIAVVTETALNYNTKIPETITSHRLLPGEKRTFYCHDSMIVNVSEVKLSLLDEE